MLVEPTCSGELQDPCEHLQGASLALFRAISLSQRRSNTLPTINSKSHCRFLLFPSAIGVSELRPSNLLHRVTHLSLLYQDGVDQTYQTVVGFDVVRLGKWESGWLLMGLWVAGSLTDLMKGLQRLPAGDSFAAFNSTYSTAVRS